MAGDGIALWVNQHDYTPTELRAFEALGLAPAGALSVRPGLRPGPGPTVTVGGSTGSETVTVTGFGGWIGDPATGGGCYPFVIPNTVVKAMAADWRPPSGQTRLAEVYVRLTGSPTGTNADVRDPEVVVALGASSTGTPVAPAVPVDAVRVIGLQVPASGAVGKVRPGQVTGPLGFAIPVGSQAEEDALLKFDGARLMRTDLTGGTKTCRDGAWRIDPGHFLANEAAIWGDAPPAGTPMIQRKRSMAVVVGNSQGRSSTLWPSGFAAPQHGIVGCSVTVASTAGGVSSVAVNGVDSAGITVDLFRRDAVYMPSGSNVQLFVDLTGW